MNQTNKFIALITEKQDLIYKEINQFIVVRFGNQQEMKVKDKEFYLSDPDSYDLKARQVTGLAVQNGVAYVTMQLDPEDIEEGTPDLWYNITHFMVEDVLNIISDVFD